MGLFVFRLNSLKPISRNFCWLVYSTLFVLSHSVSKASNQCMVSAPAGKIRGVVRESVLNSDIKFCAFLGIPYGRLTRNERFQRPLLAKPLLGVYNATSDGSECPQISQLDGGLEGNENCLYLNVFTPKTYKAYQRRPLLPVIVYIHGGAYTYGSSSSENNSPDFLIQHGIVFVAMNYRLNVFGFLNLRIPECGGNMGLRDQVVALEWVQRNIGTFGGDAKSVTIMGLSAGAISTFYLPLSPITRGLFQRAITQSAIAHSLVLDENVQLFSIQFAKYMGYRGDVKQRYEILQYLRKLTTKQLLSGFQTFTKRLKSQLENYAKFSFFRVSADHDLGSLALFPTNSIETLRRQVPAIDIIVGQTDLDSSYFFYKHNVPEFIASVQKYLKFFLDPAFTKDKRVENVVIPKVKEYYFNSSNNEDLLTVTLKLLTDILYFRFYERNAIFKASYDNCKIYNYQFRFDGSLEYTKKLYLGEYARKVRGVSHADDINYILYSKTKFPKLTLTNDDRRIIYEMSTWWTNFAKTGNPNGKYDYREWKPLSPQQNSYLRIDNTSYWIPARINEREREFWDSLPRTYLPN